MAFKQVFPALQALVRDGRLDFPVVGVASAGWGLEQLRARARESLEAHGRVDERAFSRLCALLHYVDGDYRDSATFQAMRRKLAGARRPLHYLPPRRRCLALWSAVSLAPATSAKRFLCRKNAWPFVMLVVHKVTIRRFSAARLDAAGRFRVRA